MKTLKQPTEEFKFMGEVYKKSPRFCTKRPCKCEHGEPHGFYWYANGKYIGKEISYQILVSLADLESKQDYIKKNIDKTREKIRKKLAELTLLEDIENNLQLAKRHENFNEDFLKEQGIKIFEKLI